MQFRFGLNINISVKAGDNENRVDNQQVANDRYGLEDERKGLADNGRTLQGCQRTDRSIDQMPTTRNTEQNQIDSEELKGQVIASKTNEGIVKVFWILQKQHGSNSSRQDMTKDGED